MTITSSILATTSNLSLISPSNDYRRSYEEAQREGEFALRQRQLEKSGILRWFAHRSAIKNFASHPTQRVYWLVRGYVFVGEIEVTCLESIFPTAVITHYCVRASMRGEGYGTKLLRLLVDHLASEGFSTFNLWIDRGNLASIAAAKRNGAVLTRTVREEMDEYRINITPGQPA